MIIDGVTFKFHLLCSGVTSGSFSVLGNGVVVDIKCLLEEIDTVQAQLNEKYGDKALQIESLIKISDRAHIVLPLHVELDASQEDKRGANKIGTTRRGTGPCYSSKATRESVRFGELKNFEAFEKRVRNIYKFYDVTDEAKINKVIEEYRVMAKRLVPMITDTVVFLNKILDDGDDIIAEGANSALLDIDFGTYPNCTSSTCTIGGVFSGLGVAPKNLGTTIGVIKAYQTRVGTGGFPTLLKDKGGEYMQTVGFEFGTSTGRKRDCGWFDIIPVNYGNVLNDYSYYVLTKLDVLTGLTKLKICVGYKLDGEFTTTTFPANFDDFQSAKPISNYQYL